MNLPVEVTKLLLPLIALAISAALALAARYLREKTKNEVANRAISAVENIVRSAVLEAKQTIVDSLKEQNGGKLTDEDKEEIKTRVLKAIKARLTDETLKELKWITQDIEGYLSSLIESYVHIHKDLPGFTGGK